MDILEENIGSIDFWTNADKQKRTRSRIKQALTLTGISELKENRERVAIEIMKQTNDTKTSFRYRISSASRHQPQNYRYSY
ncbi:MAG TPA: hypothetical protein VHO70_16515 [Chitinispirillaceae bacterium]|nr:hypothetical protein [Chitinispirillaceae bacterium]